MNSINIRFEVSFGTGSEYDAEALQKIQQELATTVKRLQAQYTKNNSSRTSPPPKQQTDFFQFARAETENMTKASRFNTARNYRTAISRLHQYVSFTLSLSTPSLLCLSIISKNISRIKVAT